MAAGASPGLLFFHAGCRPSYAAVYEGSSLWTAPPLRKPGDVCVTVEVFMAGLTGAVCCCVTRYLREMTGMRGLFWLTV